MKKRWLLAIAALLTAGTVNAQTVNYKKNNYLFLSEFKCGTEDVEFYGTVGITNKIIVDKEGEYLVWHVGNICTPMTTQDSLDILKHSYSNTDYISDKEVEMLTSDEHFEYGYFPATGSFDPDADYYIYSGTMAVKVENPVVEDFSTYLTQFVFKHPEKAIIDSNIDYYKTIPMSQPLKFEKVDSSDLDINDIEDYYVITTPEDVNIKIKSFTADDTIYNELDQTYQYVMVDFIGNDPYYFALDLDAKYHYFDKNGVEVEKFYDKFVFINDYFYIIMDYSVFIDGTGNLDFYDASGEHLIKTLVYNEDKSFVEPDMDGNVLTIFTDDGVYEGAEIIIAYNTLEGYEQTYNNKDLVFKFSGVFDNFKELRINGKVVPSDKYTVTKGSTIITLKKEYIDTLDKGTYNLEVVYTDGGTALASFTIDSNPNTIDNIITYSIIGSSSLLGLVLLSIISKRNLKDKQ